MPAALQPPQSVLPRRGIVLLLLVLALVTVSAAVAQIWTRLQAIEYGYKISRATKENAELQEINRRLRLEEALLKSPQRISQIAATRLGMHPPRPEQVHRLRELPQGENATDAQAVARVTR